MATPPVVFVDYNPESNTISANPARLEVPSGTFILTWLKADANAPWSFFDLNISGSQAGCFNLKTVRPSTMSIVDGNDGASCHDEHIQYTITIEHSVLGQITTSDPEIENKPTG